MCFGSCDATNIGNGIGGRGNNSGIDFRPLGPVRCLPVTDELRAESAAALQGRAIRLAERERAIDEMCARETPAGHEPDRMYWTMVYDFEMAPRTNGRTMLIEVGILAIPPQDLAEDAHLHEALWTVIEALAAHRVFLLNTDHLSDRQLYERLFYKILDEPTHCLPPSSSACEYIDVLHAMDIQAGGLGAELDRRLLSGEHPKGEPQWGTRAPPQTTPICDRDRFMPRPPP